VSDLRREALQRVFLSVTLDDGLGRQGRFLEVVQVCRSAIVKTVGRVVGLWRYPVKSMGPEALSEARVSWHGLEGDRRWAFIRNGAVRSGFPWLTLRERADMAQYRPSLTEPARPETSPTVVRTPSGDLFDVTDPALAAECCPAGARVHRQSRGIFDTFPLSLITTQAIHRLGESVGYQLDVQRFRPNILVEAAEDGGFPEDDWMGCVLRLGTLRLRVDKHDGRCVVINIDPLTTERDPAVLRAVAAERQGCLGVYGSTVEPGCVTVGDPVQIESKR
jgi:uncharacterized protein YcbX